jgi:hypothetical protein
MDSRLRMKQVVIFAGVLCLIALPIGTAGIHWRLRQLDVGVRPTTAKLESLQDQDNAAQMKADQLREYPLPDELVSALVKPRNFRVCRSVADVPDSVRSAFAKAADEKNFSMADPNGRWEPTDVIRDPQLPRRRLASAAIGEGLCLLFYARGGIGRTITSPFFECLMLTLSLFGTPTSPVTVPTPLHLQRRSQKGAIERHPSFEEATP